MAVVAVAANNTRVDDAEAASGWSSIGGGQGPSAEGSFPYQGGNLVNKKITGTGGVRYDPVVDGGSAHDVTAAAKAHWMVKGIVTDYGGLNAASGVRVQIGSSSTVFHEFVIAGTDAVKNALDNYPSRGGLVIVPVNPNIAGYRNNAASPTLTAVDHFGFEANFDSSTAKAENVGCDAIDLGTGLTLTGGDGASTEGDWDDFVAADEGITNNRWGYATSEKGGAVKAFFGQMTIGDGSTATEFIGTGEILWLDGLFSAGFNRAFLDLTLAGIAYVDDANHNSLGTTNVEDTRTDYVCSGTARSATLSHTLKNFRNYVLTSSVTLDGADAEFADLTQASATIQNSTLRPNSASGVAACNDADLTKWTNCQIIQSGAGHVIEITTPGTYTLTNLSFSGFGGTPGSNAVSSTGANDAEIYNNSGGSVTINLSGSDVPAVRNGAGATTTVNIPQVTVTFQNLPIGGEFRIYDDDGDANPITLGTDREGVETLVSSTYILNHSTAEDGNIIYAQILDPSNFEEQVIEVTLGTGNQTFNINLTPEENT